MLRTGVLIDPRLEAHEPGGWHPERPERIAALLDALSGWHRDGLVPLAVRSAADDDLLLVRTLEHVRAVRDSGRHERFAFDPDTWTCPASDATARLAGGAGLAAVDAVMADEVDNAFALVRPPGHHAEADGPRGFCLFSFRSLAGGRVEFHP